MRKIRSLSVCLCILILSACTTPSLEPIHYEVIDQNPEHVMELFQKWEQVGGLLIPESSFTVFKTSHEYLCITTPTSWQGNALRAKVEFKKTVLQRIKANEYTSAMPLEKQHGKYHLFVHGKERIIGEQKSLDTPFHALCLIDLSGDAKQEDARNVMSHSFQEWLHESNLTSTSTWRVILVGRTRDTAQNLGTISIENHTPALSYLLAQEQFKKIVLPEQPDQHGSAIIEALHFGMSLLSEMNAVPHAITLNSDLREVNHVFDFSQNIPSSDSFSSWLKQESMMMDFHETQIEVIGISHTTTGQREYSAKEYESLITFWRKTLERMNAGSVSIRSHGGD